LGDLREAEGTGDKKLERWMFSDWLNKVPGSQKSAAIPILKKGDLKLYIYLYVYISNNSVSTYASINNPFTRFFLNIYS
jgi:hypothetical protein